MEINDASKQDTNEQSNVAEPNTKRLTPEELEQLLSKEVTMSLRVVYNFKNIIEVMTNREPTRASEMAGVGQLYNDLQKLLSDNVKVFKNKVCLNIYKWKTTNFSKQKQFNQIKFEKILDIKI